MRILWVVTKPPWPVRDGGRVVMANTLRALRAAGHECVVVAPFDPAREDRHGLTASLRDFCEPHLVAAPPRSIGVSMLLACARGIPLTIGRHTVTAVGAEVERLLSDRPFDVVHAEQLQALAQCDPARRRSVPIVLRSQNVESDLWATLATARPLLRPLVRRESGRLARYEGKRCVASRRAVALTGVTPNGCVRCRHGATGSTASRRRSPTGSSGTAALGGEPPVVVLASGWRHQPGRRRVVLPTVWPKCARTVRVRSSICSARPWHPIGTDDGGPRGAGRQS